MTTIDRPLPPLNADERTTLEGWLDFHRATLAMKCDGLNDEQAAAAPVAPSVVSMTGLVQHMAEVPSRGLVSTELPLRPGDCLCCPQA